MLLYAAIYVVLQGCSCRRFRTVVQNSTSLTCILLTIGMLTHSVMCCCGASVPCYVVSVNKCLLSLWMWHVYRCPRHGSGLCWCRQSHGTCRFTQAMQSWRAASQHCSTAYRRSVYYHISTARLQRSTGLAEDTVLIGRACTCGPMYAAALACMHALRFEWCYTNAHGVFPAWLCCRPSPWHPCLCGSSCCSCLVIDHSCTPNCRKECLQI